MTSREGEATVAPSETDDRMFAKAFSELPTAISDAIDALVAWDLDGFESAVERQRELANRLLLHPEWLGSSDRRNFTLMARKIQLLNRVYEQLLQHSISWTRTQQSILHSGADPICSRASVHFRG